MIMDDEHLEKLKAAGMCAHGNFPSTCKMCAKENEQPGQKEAERSVDILAEVERDREREHANTTVALEIIQRLQAACAAPDFLSLAKDERLKMLLANLQEMWPENDNRGATTSFRLNAIDAGMDDAVLRLAPMTASANLGTDLKGRTVMRLGLRQILEAQPDTLTTAIEKVNLYIVHEMEHVIAFGDEDLSGGEDDAQRFAYLSHPGEMRAYAKMFAFLYCRQTPEDFSPEKMLTLWTAFSDAAMAHDYFDRYAHDDNDARRAIANRMGELTRWYVQHFRERE